MLAFCLSDKYITMNNSNIDQALAALGDALKSQNATPLDSDPKAFIKKIPLRGLSGDHIYGGKVLNFSSSGISDTATKEQIKITDESTSIAALRVGVVRDNLNVEGEITAKTVKVDVLEAKEIKAEIQFEKNTSVTFGGENSTGKGLLWTGQGYTKQLVFNQNPDRLFSSETIDVGRNKHYSVNGVKVIDENELGSSVTKSNLREVGRLRGLLVDGDVIINDFLFYNSTADRLGIGTDVPKAALTVAEDMIEVMLGTKDASRGMVGTYAGQAFDIVTDNAARISVSANGNIHLGNKNYPAIQVTVHGSMGINISTPDSRVALDVNGAVKFNNKLHLSAEESPKSGSFNLGDIVWNSNPQQRGYIGWVCIRAGSPGVWNGFGKID
jgi:hypothetical protein